LNPITSENQELTMDINQEIIFKAEMLGARIVEVPAHLNWIIQRSMDRKTGSIMGIFRDVIANLYWGGADFINFGSWSLRLRRSNPNWKNPKKAVLIINSKSPALSCIYWFTLFW
jgi:hypothetical protein